MEYRFSKRCLPLSAEQLWAYLQNGLSKNVIIKSTKNEVKYNIIYVNADEISFSAKTRNDGDPEIIGKVDFIKVITGLKEMVDFNTSSAVPVFKGNAIYRKRSPMFALLYSSGIIEKH